ncbi:MAG: recombinase family protein [Albidovulum sp.]|nr:recombinase family protein [Albidovulum sp.]
MLEITAPGFRTEPRRIVAETVSGSVAISQRPEFARLADRLDTGDVLALAKFDRLGRDAMDAAATVAGLRRSTWTRSGTYGDRPRSGELALVGFAFKRINIEVHREVLQHNARKPLELAQEAPATNSRRDQLPTERNPAPGTVRLAWPCRKALSRAVHGQLPAPFGSKG